MRIILDREHFRGAAKVVMNTASPPLKSTVKRLSRRHTRHVGSRDHLYDERRTSVFRVGFEAYRDAHFFYEAGADDVFRAGVFLSPSDDLPHGETGAPFDAERLLPLVAAGEVVPARWHAPADCRWVATPDLTDAESAARWSQHQRVQIALEMPAADFLSLTEHQRGEIVELAMAQLVPLFAPTP